MMEINIQKTLSGTQGKLLLEVQANIPTGQLTTLYGKSGAGKTTLLRMLAGLLLPEKGTIIFNGITWLDTAQNISLPPPQRRVGFVFQDYALFPNMTVYENLRFALQKGQSADSIKPLIELIELGDLQHHKPATLSGGQQQRVALARALAQQPQILLLDEPLSALDQEMRNKLQTYLLQIQSVYKLTTILVSHDIAEIRKLATEVLVLDQGKVVRQGPVNGIFPTNTSRLSGKILAIQMEGTTCKVIVGIGENEVVVWMDPSTVDGLTIGDGIEVAVDFGF
jgi:molybdate transport system ATP-binding protein